MRLATVVRVAAAVLIAGGVFAHALAQEEGGRRVALVVGNSGYRAVPALANTANDARMLAQALRAKGFTLVGGEARLDLNRAQFNAALDAFAQALKGSDVGLFFYAGHGMQVRGANWLVPVDAAPRQAGDLEQQMINAVRVLEAMRAGGTRLNLVILDACRDNPFPTLQTPGGESGLTPVQGAGSSHTRSVVTRGLDARGGGLAQMQAPEGTVIAFATQPGDVALDGAGADSPFTVALVQALQQPGLDVLALFNQVGVAVKHATGGRQQPWVASSPIEGAYFLGEQASGTPRVAATAIPTASPGADALLAKVRARAAPRGIPVPARLRLAPAAPDVPPQYARFLGAWGPGEWNTRRGTNTFILVVNGIDRAGQADIMLMNSAGCIDADCTVRAPFIGHTSATVQDGRLTFRSNRNGHEFAFWPVRDDQLAATNQAVPGRTLTTSLPRID